MTTPSEYQPGRQSPTQRLLRWFDFDHLPPHLQNASSHFKPLAMYLERTLPGGAEKTTALRKLLESKDAAVRAAIEAHEAELAQDDPPAGVGG